MRSSRSPLPAAVAGVLTWAFAVACTDAPTQPQIPEDTVVEEPLPPDAALAFERLGAAIDDLRERVLPAADATAVGALDADVGRLRSSLDRRDDAAIADAVRAVRLAVDRADVRGGAAAIAPADLDAVRLVLERVESRRRAAPPDGGR